MTQKNISHTPEALCDKFFRSKKFKLMCKEGGKYENFDKNNPEDLRRVRDDIIEKMPKNYTESLVHLKVMKVKTSDVDKCRYQVGLALSSLENYTKLQQEAEKEGVQHSTPTMTHKNGHVGHSDPKRQGKVFAEHGIYFEKYRNVGTLQH